MINTSEENYSKQNWYSQLTRTQIILLFVGFVGLFLISVGLGMSFLSDKKETDDIQILSSVDTAVSADIFVHVDGAVVDPGLYKLTAGSRTNDAIAAAGGLSPEADSARVNLATKLVDGQKVLVPKIGEASTGGVGVGEAGGPINVNSASQSELESLPGIGPATAVKIIASRPYGSLEDLVSKKAVSSGVMEKIRDLVTF